MIYDCNENGAISIVKYATLTDYCNEIDRCYNNEIELHHIHFLYMICGTIKVQHHLLIYWRAYFRKFHLASYELDSLVGCLSQLPPQSCTNNILPGPQDSINEESDINIRFCRDSLFFIIRQWFCYQSAHVKHYIWTLVSAFTSWAATAIKFDAENNRSLSYDCVNVYS